VSSIMKGKERPILAAFILLALISLGCSLARPILERVRSSDALASLNTDSEEAESARQRRPTPRPTFTPTPNYTPTPTNTATPTITPIPTETLTPVPTNTRPPPPPSATFTPAPTPTPDFPFKVVEQGNREFQHTTYHIITIYVALIDANNVPIGGLKMVGDHVPSGRHAESALSDWSWSVTNCLSCDYIKQGNLKFEPGPFEDGTWEIYVADSGGTQLSQKIPLSFSSSPDTWVWDFFIFQRK
jgi:hypothetical protein